MKSNSTSPREYSRRSVRIAILSCLALGGLAVLLAVPATRFVQPAGAAAAAPAAAPAAPLKLNKGDHIVIIGNTLADRMQFEGTLETLIYGSNPQSEIVVRNISMPADEVVLRLRGQNFGSPDDWLNQTKADVIF